MSKALLAGALAVSLGLGGSVALAGETIDEAGTITCVTDKWDEKEVAKGHKTADAVQRCVLIPDDPTAEKVAEDCQGSYEYLPDGTWKASGTCVDKFKSGDSITSSWEEGSHLKDYTYKKTGGTGKFKGATGGGTYMYENVTDTLAGGRYQGRIVLP